MAPTLGSLFLFEMQWPATLERYPKFAGPVLYCPPFFTKLNAYVSVMSVFSVVMTILILMHK
jgi:hypothetical protein